MNSGLLNKEKSMGGIKMKYITMESLDERRDSQMEYFKKSNPSCLPKDMFDENDEFSYNNWNCGQGQFIRHFINDLEYGVSNIKEFDVEYRNFDLCVSGAVIATKHYYEDFTYVQITVDAYMCKYSDDDYNEEFIDQYLIKIYKSRGAIEDFRKNGQPIKRGEYVALLNILQESGLLKYEQ